MRISYVVFTEILFLYWNMAWWQDPLIYLSTYMCRSRCSVLGYGVSKADDGLCSHGAYGLMRKTGIKGAHYSRAESSGSRARMWPVKCDWQTHQDHFLKFLSFWYFVWLQRLESMHHITYEHHMDILELKADSYVDIHAFISLLKIPLINIHIYIVFV